MRYPVDNRLALLLPALFVNAALITALFAVSSARAQRDTPQAKVLREDIARLQGHVGTLFDAVPGVRHLDGDDREWGLHAGGITVTLGAEATGGFPLALHSAGADRGVFVGYLVVHP